MSTLLRHLRTAASPLGTVREKMPFGLMPCPVAAASMSQAAGAGNAGSFSHKIEALR
jgi:hypothetical protein